MVRFDPETPPATNSARSLDFDQVRVTGSLLNEDKVQIEISYREAVIDPLEPTMIGAPFYEDFEILPMSMPEMAAEKLRTLAQRVRPTDLADLAVLLTRNGGDDAHIEELAIEKFKLVKSGSVNRVQRIEQYLQELGTDYDDTVPVVFPDAPSYQEAMKIVWPRIKPLIPYIFSESRFLNSYICQIALQPVMMSADRPLSVAANGRRNVALLLR